MIEHNGVLADPAGLGQQLQSQLAELAATLSRRVPALNRKFLKKLRALNYTPDQCAALEGITTGASAQSLASGLSLNQYLEEVQYRGRRLAKLGLTPASVVAALREFDSLVEAQLGPRLLAQAANYTWVRDQLHFLVILTLNKAFYQVREAESHAFYELFRAEVESTTLGEMIARFLEILSGYTGAEAARLYLIDETGRFSSAAAPAEPSAKPAPAALALLAKPQLIAAARRPSRLVLDPVWHGRYRTCWSVPLSTQGKLHGVLQFAFSKDYAWLPREIDLLQAAAERCWRAAEKARLLDDLRQREEQIRRLAGHMVEVEESERRRISRELHDEAGQSLLCIRLQLEMLESELPPALDPWKERLAGVRQMTEHTIIEIRRLIAALSPAVLEQMGLAAALRQLVARFRSIHQATVHVEIPRRLDVSKRTQIIAYRLVQEILNNVAKYSLASHVNLCLHSADGCLRLDVEDNGVGFDVDKAFARGDCFGLSGLRERVALLGGTLSVRSLLRAETPPSSPRAKPASRKPGAPGRIGVDLHGTSIQAVLPLDGEARGMDLNDGTAPAM